MAMVQGEEMEEGEVTEDGELSDIRYVFSLPCLPYFCSVTEVREPPRHRPGGGGRPGQRRGPGLSVSHEEGQHRLRSEAPDDRE